MGREGSIEFVAEAAPLFADDLVKESIFFTDDFATEVDVEVFKGHGEEVGAMDFSQRFWRRSGWASVVDAAQVCGHIQHTVDWMMLAVLQGQRISCSTI